MKNNLNNLSKTLLSSTYSDLENSQQMVIDSIAGAEPIVENVNVVFHDQLTFGQRLADKISEFGGSWKFIVIFFAVLLVWMIMNSIILASPKEAFDPYPYILLNLVLSSLAALQAPIIMMSQNRQTAKERLDITENYKVSLKTDLEIIRLHQKIDELTKKLSSDNEQS